MADDVAWAGVEPDALQNVRSNLGSWGLRQANARLGHQSSVKLRRGQRTVDVQTVDTLHLKLHPVKDVNVGFPLRCLDIRSSMTSAPSVSDVDQILPMC